MLLALTDCATIGQSGRAVRALATTRSRFSMRLNMRQQIMQPYLTGSHANHATQALDDLRDTMRQTRQCRFASVVPRGCEAPGGVSDITDPEAQNGSKSIAQGLPNAVTEQVSAIDAVNVHTHAVLVKITSGQLPF